MCWSSGKDSALALHELKRTGFDVVGLLTTVTEGYDRISMHGVRRELLKAQVESISLPLAEVWISRDASEDSYRREMRSVLESYVRQGVLAAAFGDVFLADIRAYRERNLAQVGMQALFPLWQQDTRQLALRFVELGFEAIVTCVDTCQLDASFAGRHYDRAFLADLPEGVDPCGENGEFHTFVYAGPVFSQPLAVAAGQTVLRDNRFMFCEVTPA